MVRICLRLLCGWLLSQKKINNFFIQSLTETFELKKMCWQIIKIIFGRFQNQILEIRKLC